jgi:hypothetical protein
VPTPDLGQISSSLADAFAAVADRERLLIELEHARAALADEQALTRRLKLVIALTPFNRPPAVQAPPVRRASHRPLPPRELPQGTPVTRTWPRGIPAVRRSID